MLRRSRCSNWVIVRCPVIVNVSCCRLRYIFYCWYIDIFINNSDISFETIVASAELKTVDAFVRCSLWIYLLISQFSMRVFYTPHYAANIQKFVHLTFRKPAWWSKQMTESFDAMLNRFYAVDARMIETDRADVCIATRDKIVIRSQILFFYKLTWKFQE